MTFIVLSAPLIHPRMVLQHYIRSCRVEDESLVHML